MTVMTVMRARGLRATLAGMGGALLVVVVGASGGCKRKAHDAPAAPPVVADAAVAAVVDAAAAVVDAAPVAEPPMPSVQLVTDGLGPILLAGPARVALADDVVWCTRGDNGMAEWVETICHVVAPGKKPTVIPVLTYADAMAVDEGVDGAADPDGGPRSASARARAAAAIVRIGDIAGPGLEALPRPVGCSFVHGEFTARDDELTPSAPGASSDAAAGCVVDGLTAAVNPQGKVTVVSADKVLFTEVFKPRQRGKGEGGDACFLEVSHLELAVDRGAHVVALAIGLSNPSDSCALVTEFEVRIAKLP